MMSEAERYTHLLYARLAGLAEDVQKASLRAVARSRADSMRVVDELLQEWAQDALRAWRRLARRVLGAGWAEAERLSVQAHERAPMADLPAIPTEYLQLYERMARMRFEAGAQAVTDTVIDAVMRATTEGWDTPTLMQALRKIFGAWELWKLEAVARSETMHLWNGGLWNRFQAEQDLVGYEYAVVEDARTSEICRGYEGKRVRRENLRDVPPLHPNCRTTLLPIYQWEAEGVEWQNPSDLPRPARYYGGTPPVLVVEATA